MGLTAKVPSDVGSVRGDEAEKQALPSIWSVIDSSLTCISNRENIVPFKETQQASLDTCKLLCENHGKCTAVDWYSKTRICLMYQDACTTPTADHDGGVSLRVVRADLLPPTGSETKVLGDSASATVSGQGSTPTAKAGKRDPMEM